MKITNILVIVDPTATEHPAIDKALRIAIKCDARIELLACETKESLNVRFAAHLARNAAHSFIVNLRAMLEDLAQPIRQQGIDACLETEVGDPLHRVLLERIKRGSADLVVKDTHHHSLLKRTLITNTDWHLIRECPVPLLLTKASAWQPQPVVAAAIDPGHEYDRPRALDERILASAHFLAARFGTDLCVFNAVLPLMATAETTGGPLAISNALTARAVAEACALRRGELERVIAPFGVNMADLHVRLGVASEELPALARDVGADVLVMGAVSRSGLERLFIGSTAEHVLESLSCDVLVIKAPDLAAALPV
jgi:universal stress protein E